MRLLCSIGFYSVGKIAKNELSNSTVVLALSIIYANKIARRVVIEHNAFGYLSTFRAGFFRKINV